MSPRRSRHARSAARAEKRAAQPSRRPAAPQGRRAEPSSTHAERLLAEGGLPCFEHGPITVVGEGRCQVHDRADRGVRQPRRAYCLAPNPGELRRDREIVDAAASSTNPSLRSCACAADHAAADDRDPDRGAWRQSRSSARESSRRGSRSSLDRVEHIGGTDPARRCAIRARARFQHAGNVDHPSPTATIGFGGSSAGPSFTQQADAIRAGHELLRIGATDLRPVDVDFREHGGREVLEEVQQG